MPDFHIELPPVLRGSEKEQLAALYRYLFRLAETLNSTLPDLIAGGGKEKTEHGDLYTDNH